MAEPVSRGAGGVRGYGVPLCAGVRGGSDGDLRGWCSLREGRSGEPGEGAPYPEETGRAPGLAQAPTITGLGPSPPPGTPVTATRDTGPPFRGRPAGRGALPQSPPGAPGLLQRSALSAHRLPGAASSARRPQASGLSAARLPGCVCSLGACAFQALFRDTLHAMDAPLLCGVLGRVVCKLICLIFHLWILCPFLGYIIFGRASSEVELLLYKMETLRYPLVFNGVI